jgi:hypothetical protein
MTLRRGSLGCATCSASGAFTGTNCANSSPLSARARSDVAFDLLYELGSDTQTFEQCEDNFINALAALDTPRARELLLGFVDPEIRGPTA